MNKAERLHALLEKKPRAKLGFFPTPLYKLERLSEQLGVQLYIKRDDFSGMSLFGGNKIRKLEYLIGDAQERDATRSLLTAQRSLTMPCRP